MKRNKVIHILLCAVMIFSMLAACSQSVPTETQTTVKRTTQVDEVTISPEVEKTAEKTKEIVAAGENIGSDITISASPKEETSVIDEGALESDGTVEQENIPYDGTNTGKGKSLLGKCTGLTYYSQADSRWASVVYTSSNKKSQTIKSSGCGPTCAAMVVSSSKGAITPNTMAKLFVDNGYRTKSNGTAWSVWSFVADYFNFKKYRTTSNINIALSYLKTDKNKDGASDYFVVASCGSGLFTTSGHYVLFVADKNGTVTVYDPYYYKGKFNTPSRRAAKVKTSGNIAYVTEAKLKKYGNTKSFWIFSNDYSKPKKRTTTKKPATTKKVTYKTTVGKTYTLKGKTTLYSKSNLTGKKYSYLPKTKVKVLSHASASVDKIKVIKTGRIAYIKSAKLK